LIPPAAGLAAFAGGGGPGGPEEEGVAARAAVAVAAAAAVAAAGACGAARGDSMRGRLASPARLKELRWLLLVLALAGVDGRASGALLEGALLEGGLDGSRRKPSSTDAKPPVLDEVMRDSSISTRTRSAEDMAGVCRVTLDFGSFFF